MCWYSNDVPKAQYATEDILVFKIFEKLKSNYALSLMMRFYYKYDKLYKVSKLKIKKDQSRLGETYYCIYRGFHSISFRFINTANCNPSYVAPCIIPKGATYYVNTDNGEIVSDKIIIPKQKID